MDDELSNAKRELQKYPGNEIPVADAVSILAHVTGLRVHLLRDEEISEALEHARQLIASEKVRQGPYNVKNEVVKASREAWADLTPEARSLVRHTMGRQNRCRSGGHNFRSCTYEGEDSVFDCEYS